MVEQYLTGKMYLSCICGGWIELIFISGGVILTSLWGFFKKICSASGCFCECHKLNHQDKNEL
jgi:hypothetical protein